MKIQKPMSEKKIADFAKVVIAKNETIKLFGGDPDIIIDEDDFSY